MENITFSYNFDNDGDEKEVILTKNADGLHDYDICEMFVNFMNSVGFSEDNVFRYFQK